MKILVLNAGSSSLKYQLFNMDNGDVLAKGLCECIGGKGGSVTHKYADNKHVIETELEDHEKALSAERNSAETLAKNIPSINLT